MTGAIRAVSTQRGRDVRDFALVAFGGCGPAHAALLARDMGIGTVVVPPSPGLFSAFGLLATDLELQRARTLYAESGTLAEGTRLAGILATLESEIEAEFSRETGSASLDWEVWADMRYEGQSYDLPIVAPAGLAPAAMVEALVDRFEAEHERTYGQRARNERVVVVAIRLNRPRCRRRERHRRRRRGRRRGARIDPRRLVRSRPRLDADPGRRTRLDSRRRTGGGRSSSRSTTP